MANLPCCNSCQKSELLPFIVMVNVQERLACLALALDPAAVLATEVRAQCRMAQGLYFGARKDFEMLAATGGNVAKVSLLQCLPRTSQHPSHENTPAAYGRLGCADDVLFYI